MALKEGLTIRETCLRLPAAETTPLLTGTVAEVASEMGEWFRSGACDGLVVGVPALPGSRRFAPRPA